jgi:hypothetical protein
MPENQQCLIPAWPARMQQIDPGGQPIQPKNPDARENLLGQIYRKGQRNRVRRRTAVRLAVGWTRV